MSALLKESICGTYSEAEQQAGLADARVANQKQLEQVVAVGQACQKMHSKVMMLFDTYYSGFMFWLACVGREETGRA